MGNNAKPNISSSAIQRAGKVLESSKVGTSEYQTAINTVNYWRLQHAFPMGVYRRSLRRQVKKYRSPLVAQRLKRMPTIIDKLTRHKGMNLSRMHDIGGVRGIVDSVDEVREIEKFFKSKSELKSTLIENQCKDYLDSPKPDGYRGIHLVFKYENLPSLKSPVGDKYDGMLIEMQVRTKLQHTWATAVETVGIFRDEALKSGKGSDDWLKFFALVSASFAKLEGTAPIPGYEHLDINSTFAELARFEDKNGFLALLENMSFAARVIHTDKSVMGVYHVITLNPKERSLTVSSFGKGDLERASQYYALAEARASKGESLETVLVSVGKMINLQKAYPNYYLDIKDFVKKIKILIDEINI